MTLDIQYGHIPHSFVGSTEEVNNSNWLPNNGLPEFFFCPFTRNIDTSPGVSIFFPFRHNNIISARVCTTMWNAFYSVRNTLCCRLFSFFRATTVTIICKLYASDITFVYTTTISVLSLWRTQSYRDCVCTRAAVTFIFYPATLRAFIFCRKT